MAHWEWWQVVLWFLPELFLFMVVVIACRR
jgi:hypothetical protein